MATVPVNFRRGSLTAAEARDAASYAVQIAGNFLVHLSKSPGALGQDPLRPLDGLELLEIGPGRSMASALLLACAGARVSVADRFLASWDDEYHRPVFDELLEQVRSRGDDYCQPIRLILAMGSFDSALTSHALGAEQVWTLGRTFDVILSNAVLEHVEDLQATAQSLAASTAVGGIGVHQIDLRDHRDFNRPLEFLTLPADQFAAIRRDAHCECGAVWRASDVEAAFDAAGFDVSFETNMTASPEYLGDVRARLQPQFAGYMDEDLARLGALFRLRRRGDRTATRTS